MLKEQQFFFSLPMVVNIWQNVGIGGLGPAPSPSPCKSLPQTRQEMSHRHTKVCQQNPSCDEVQKDFLFLRPGDRAGAGTPWDDSKVSHTGKALVLSR